MATFVVPNFQGIAPRYADRLLDPSQSSFVTNLKPTNGDLRGFRSVSPITVHNPSGVTYRRSIRFFKSGTDDSVFFKSEDVNATALKSPLAQDAFDRIYFLESGSALRVTTFDDLVSGDPSLPAGVPRPVTAPTVTPPGGGTPDTRAYVYTYQTPFGSEGPPSPPTIATGDIAGTWALSGLSGAPSYANKINIYRTATGQQSSGNYYKVGEVTPPTSTFNDTMPNDNVPLQPELDSLDNDPPIVGMQGLVKHSSGAFAAFKDRTVYFSLPYLPHAWPGDFAYPVDDTIVGIAAILNYIVVLTKGNPFILAGDQPANIAIVKLPDVEPCTSQRSIVVMSNACYFASPNGLCSISQTGLTRPTNALLTREEFKAFFPEQIIAGSYGSYYIAFFEESRGFAVALPPYEPTSLVPLDRYAGVTGVDTDYRTGDLFVTQSDRVGRFDAQLDQRFPTTWRSKEFIHPYPINLGAFQLLIKVEQKEDDAAQQLLLDAMEEYNQARFDEGPLDAFDLYPVNGEIALDDPPEPDPILAGLAPQQPLGGEPLYNLLDLFNGRSTNFTLIADGKVKYSKVITDEEVHSLPEGYKATRYYFEVSGAAQIQRIVVAETRRECRNA